jgi:sphingolipid 4-desaturase/C4-monooxygenase
MTASISDRAMSPPPAGGIYVTVTDQQPHADRARIILDTHPEVRALLGVNRWSGVLALGVVGLQLGLAIFSTTLPGWQAGLLAFFVGAYINHTLWVLVHETAHHLIFRTTALNRCTTILCNLPMVIPSTVMFCVYHLMHHKHMGEIDRDADLPRPGCESWLLQHGFAGRLAWQCLFPVVQSLRTLRLDSRCRSDSWMCWVYPNFFVQVAFDAALLLLFGPSIFVYLLLSMFFSIGPHPLGARWIQEHYRFREGQETYSYYGVLNILALNVGYHNEHHDLTRVPWHRLPTLRRLVPEMYEPLYSHSSWLRLWLRFLFDSKLEIVRFVRPGGAQAGAVETASASAIPPLHMPCDVLGADLTTPPACTTNLNPVDLIGKSRGAGR